MTTKQLKGHLLGFVFIWFLCLHVWAPHIQAQNVTDWINEEKDEIEEEQSPVEPVQNQNEPTQQPSIIWSLIKMAGILVVMIGLLYVAVRFFTKRNRQMRDLHLLENLGGIPVGQQKSIQLVRVGSMYYLIGVGENVELLQVIEDEEMIHELASLAEEREENGLLPGFIRNKWALDKEDTTSSFTHIYEKELDHLMNNRSDMIRSYQKREKENE